jgi:hypothetical protein
MSVTTSVGTGPLSQSGVITIRKRDANAGFAYAAATRQRNSVFANMDLQLGNSPAVPILDVTFTNTVAMRVARQAYLPPCFTTHQDDFLLFLALR